MNLNNTTLQKKNQKKLQIKPKLNIKNVKKILEIKEQKQYDTQKKII